jgi:hypothetical protein
MVDECRMGCVFIAFGENRYLGGENASSLNVDFTIQHGTLLVDGQVVVDRGSPAGLLADLRSSGV